MSPKPRSATATPDITFKKAFLADKTVHAYRASALTVFGLALYLNVSDIDDFAAEAITDSSTDKKIDACYIDQDEGRVIVAQGYTASRWGKKEGPANKASDLNAAITWLLNTPEENLPPWLRAKAQEIKQSIGAGEIKRIEIFGSPGFNGKAGQKRRAHADGS